MTNEENAEAVALDTIARSMNAGIPAETAIAETILPLMTQVELLRPVAVEMARAASVSQRWTRYQNQAREALVKIGWDWATDAPMKGK